MKDILKTPNLNLAEVRIGVSIRRLEVLFQTTPDEFVGRVAAQCGPPARRYFEPYCGEQSGNHVVAVLVDRRIEFLFRRLLEFLHLLAKFINRLVEVRTIALLDDFPVVGD